MWKTLYNIKLFVLVCCLLLITESKIKISVNFMWFTINLEMVISKTSLRTNMELMTQKCLDVDHKVT